MYEEMDLLLDEEMDLVLDEEMGLNCMRRWTLIV